MTRAALKWWNSLAPKEQADAVNDAGAFLGERTREAAWELEVSFRAEARAERKAERRMNRK